MKDFNSEKSNPCPDADIAEAKQVQRIIDSMNQPKQKPMVIPEIILKKII